MRLGGSIRRQRNGAPETPQDGRAASPLDAVWKDAWLAQEGAPYLSRLGTRRFGLTAPLGSRRGSHGGQAFFDQIALDFPVFERRQKEPVRLITMKSFVWSGRLLSRFSCCFLQLAARFCSSPASASRSRCCSHHGFFLLCPPLV